MGMKSIIYISIGLLVVIPLQAFATPTFSLNSPDGIILDGFGYLGNHAFRFDINSNLNLESHSLNNVSSVNIGTTSNTGGEQYNQDDGFTINTSKNWYTDIAQNLFYSMGWKSRQGGSGSHIEMQGGFNQPQGILFEVGNGSKTTSISHPIAMIPVLYLNQNSVQILSGNNVVYRCTTSGTLPVGTLTVNSASCGSVVDTGLRVP